jgi:hypothetical protein
VFKFDENPGNRIDFHEFPDFDCFDRQSQSASKAATDVFILADSLALK